MPAFFVFLIKVNAALLLFCAGYYLVLRHLTFYTLNRVYLMAAIVFATVYPNIDLSRFLEEHKQIAKPVEVVAINWQPPVNVTVTTVAQTNYWIWVEAIFWTVVVILAMRMMMQLFSLYNLYRSSTPSQIYGHDVRLTDSKSGPFSFWKSIYVNPLNLDTDSLRSVLMHEQIHVNELHTADILIAELSTIFYWFNPGIWLMKKAVRENIEFITDQKILKKGVDAREYQYSLVSVSFASSNSIVNYFNISTIKKRIMMMNTQRSSKFKLARYAFLIPAIVVLLLVFSLSKAKTLHNDIQKKLITPIEKINAFKKKLAKNLPSVDTNTITPKQRIKITPNKPTRAFKAEIISGKIVALDTVHHDEEIALDTIQFTGQIKYATYKPLTPLFPFTQRGANNNKMITHAEDSVVVDKVRGKTKLYGNARLYYRGMTVSAQYIEYDKMEQIVTAHGNVKAVKAVNNGETSTGEAQDFIWHLNKNYKPQQ